MAQQSIVINLLYTVYFGCTILNDNFRENVNIPELNCLKVQYVTLSHLLQRKRAFHLKYWVHAI